jgi:hypothetical protein
MTMTRDQMIAALCFRPEGMHLQGRLPTRFVTVGGSADDYADDELALLVEITATKQADYERRCGKAKFDWNDNFISFVRNDLGQIGSWGRKRYSWREGSFHKSSLPEAIAAFWGDGLTRDAVGDVCLLPSGDIVEIVEKVPYSDRDARPYDLEARSLLTDAIVGIRQSEVGVVAIAARSIDALGDSMRIAMRHRLERTTGASDADIAAATAAVTQSNAPVDLAVMWANRLLDWRERDAVKRAA